jgi:carboxymethylenebutenolidase
MASGNFVDLGAGRRGYLSVPEGAGPYPAVLVYQEAFGVNAYVQGEADRLAANGYAALAPDLFDGETFGYDEWQKLAHDGYGAIGFCMGGRLTFLSALERPKKFKAIASFYGGGIGPDEPSFGRPILIGRGGEIEASVLLLYGAEDEGITPKEHARIVETLSAAKVEFGLFVYPGAGHGFASVDRVPSYEPVAAEKAWAEALALFGRTLKA